MVDVKAESDYQYELKESLARARKQKLFQVNTRNIGVFTKIQQ